MSSVLAEAKIVDLQFGSLVRAMVARAGSRRKFAEVYGVSRGALEAIERGQTGQPTDPTFERLANAFAKIQASADPILFNGEKVQPITPSDLKALWRRQSAGLGDADDASFSPAQKNKPLPRTGRASSKACTGQPETLAKVPGTGAKVEVGQEAAKSKSWLNFCAQVEQASKSLTDLSLAANLSDEPVLLMLLAFPASRAELVLGKVKALASELGGLTACQPPVAPPGDMAAGDGHPGDEDAEGAGLGAGDSPESFTLPLGSAERLEENFKRNSALLLATLIDVHQARADLPETEDLANSLARLLKPQPDRDLTMRLVRQIAVLRDEQVLPCDATQRITLLALLARTLSSLEGTPFDGDVNALLDYLGC